MQFRKYEIIIVDHRSLFLTKYFDTLKNSKILWCYCEIFLVLVKYKGILYKIMNGDPTLLLHILDVIHLKIFY